MNNPYKHDDCDSDFGGCGDKCKRAAYGAGIAEGLRMAAEMFRASKWISFKESVPIDGYDFYQSIMAKAKEVEEAKLEK